MPRQLLLPRVSRSRGTHPSFSVLLAGSCLGLPDRWNGAGSLPITGMTRLKGLKAGDKAWEQGAWFSTWKIRPLSIERPRGESNGADWSAGERAEGPDQQASS